jgi:hypothetical protein
MQSIQKQRITKTLLRYTDAYNPGETREISDEELQAHWPASLVRACFDPLGYALGVRGGMVLHFFDAEPTANGDWVRLGRVKLLQGNLPQEALSSYKIDIAVRDIVWVAEAPA